MFMRICNQKENNEHETELFIWSEYSYIIYMTVEHNDISTIRGIKKKFTN